MPTIDFVPAGFAGKTNRSPNAKKLKKQLEAMGHTDVHVWWENMGMAMEMCGHSGGYMAISKQMRGGLEPLGYSFPEATEHLKSCHWLQKK